MTLSSSLSPLFSPTSFAEESSLMSTTTTTTTAIKTCQVSSHGSPVGDFSSSFTMNPISPPLSPTSAPRGRLFEQLVIQTPHYGQKHAVRRLDTTTTSTDLENQLSPGLLDVYCCFNCSPASGLSPLATIPSSSSLDLCGDTLPSPSTTVLLNQLLEDVSTAASAFPLLPDDASEASHEANILTATTSVAAPPAVSSKKKPVPLKTPAAPASSCAADASASTATRAPDFVFDPQRTWSIFFVDRSFLASADDDVEIRAKTRRDTPCLSVPDRLYSSLKYEIKQRAVGPFVTKVPFLLSRICVVDAKTGREVRRNNRPAVKGTIEAALVKPTDKKKKKQQQLPVSPSTAPPVLEGGLRAQFQDISFHSDHTLYCWHISYFAPSDLDHAVLVKRSPSFKVFARKPGKLSSRKRKRSTDTDTAQASSSNNYNSDDEENGDDVDAGDGGDLLEQAGDAPTDTTNICKKAKCCPCPQEEPVSASCSSASANVVFDEFMCKLDELVKCKDRLTEQERHVCLDLVVSKLLAADPSYFAALANSPQPSAADFFAPQQPDSSFIHSPDCSSFRHFPSPNLSF